ncbi:MAG: (d)CMP kinase [Chloroflexi bacterium]|nr:MAG: (d)CMP kinase [Chloroflexota bacterium]
MTRLAIDGPASSGKSSVGGRVAAALGYGFLDTGLLYRAVTRAALNQHLVSAPTAAVVKSVAPQLEKIAQIVDAELLEGGAAIVIDGRSYAAAELESAEVEALVPLVAALPEVRDALRGVQRRIAGRGRAVLAGRDIGTVVLPDAPHKFFLDASAEARALRRALQRGHAQGSTEHAQILAALIDRDREDRGRAVAPLRAAEDAITIVTDTLTLDEVVAKIVGAVQR